MNEVIAFAIASVLSWGAWGFFSKIAIGRVGWATTLIFSYLISLIVTFIFLSNKATFKINPENLLIVFVSALAGILGTLFFFLLLSKKPASIVVPLTALYPAVTIILSLIFLKEGLDIKQVVGIILALVAIFLLSF